MIGGVSQFGRGTELKILELSVRVRPSLLRKKTMPVRTCSAESDNDKWSSGHHVEETNKERIRKRMLIWMEDMLDKYDVFEMEGDTFNECRVLAPAEMDRQWERLTLVGRKKV